MTKTPLSPAQITKITEWIRDSLPSDNKMCRAVNFEGNIFCNYCGQDNFHMENIPECSRPLTLQDVLVALGRLYNGWCYAINALGMIVRHRYDGKDWEFEYLNIFFDLDQSLQWNLENNPEFGHLLLSLILE